MFKNLLKIAVRNILKDKTYSAINILGLTIGITCSLFLFLYILHELSYDRYHTNADNIYRIISHVKEPDDAFTWSFVQAPLGEELRDNYPEVKNAVRFFGQPRAEYKNGDKKFFEEDFFQTDSTVFDMFTYEFLYGEPGTALDNPNTIVISESIAKKYFGSAQDAFNQSLVNAEDQPLKITGVIKDVPTNSHFRFDALISRPTVALAPFTWGGFGVFTYIQLPPNYDLSKMQATLDKVVKEKVNPIFDQFNIKVKYGLQRITDIHLHSKIADEAEEGGDISYIYIFGAIAVFMIVIACINYMNLATARSANRAKEVGVRKVMGSQRKQLIIQFITESVVITLVALAASLILIYALLPGFNTLANKQLPFSYVMQAPVILSLLAVVIFAGVVGGSYPAFYLSGFNPVNVLKGKLSTRGGTVVFRRVLVVFQFGISIFMLICTLIVFDQLQFMRNKDLGFDKEHVLRLNISRELQSKAYVLTEKLKQSSAVAAVGLATASPGQNIGKNLFKVEDNDGRLVDRGVDLFFADFDFVKAMGMTIVQGRDFSREVSTDTTEAVLVNEAMVKRMGWTNPLGKRYVLQQGGPNNTDITRRVVGIVKDYHQNSLYSVIEPLMIVLDKNFRFAFVRTAEGDVQKSIAAVEAIWKDVYPDQPFEYQFLDSDFNSQYRGDEKRSQIFTAFSILTVVIACLGLLGLSAFTTEQRTKEIGVRKVIGASIQSLVVLVSREFFFLVGVGMVLASIAAWMFTTSWLENFAYRIEMKGEWLTFIASAAMAFMITFVTVGYHVIRAASANPVKSLRDE